MKIKEELINDNIIIEMRKLIELAYNKSYTSKVSFYLTLNDILDGYYSKTRESKKIRIKKDFNLEKEF